VQGTWILVLLRSQSSIPVDGKLLTRQWYEAGTASRCGSLISMVDRAKYDEHFEGGSMVLKRDVINLI
jgi:hypothetical protein